MTFKLPESYRAYGTDAAVRTAVDHILDSKSLSLPADIDWRGLPAFHRAVLSAHQVRCEYAIFLVEFWDAVWKPALDAFDFGTALEPLTVAESQEWCAQDLDTNTIWAQSWFGRSFKLAATGSSFVSGTCDYVDSVTLSITYYDAKEILRTDRLQLGDEWPEGHIEDGVAYSSKKLAPIHDGEIDLAPLRKAAGDALNAIRKTHARDG